MRIDISDESEIEETALKILNLLKSSKSDSVKETIKVILLYLSGLMQEPTENDNSKFRWIRSKDLFSALVETGEIPYSTQFFRTLEKLVDSGLIEKKIEEDSKYGNKKPPSFYRAKHQISEHYFYGVGNLIFNLIVFEMLYDIFKNENIALKFLLKKYLPQKLNMNDEIKRVFPEAIKKLKQEDTKNMDLLKKLALEYSIENEN